MKTFSAIIALLLFSFIFYNNFGCSDNLTSSSSKTYYIILNISGIITDRNNNPVDYASVQIWNWRYQIAKTKTNERGEYSLNTNITIEDSYLAPNLTMQAYYYAINDSGKTECWWNNAKIEMKDSPQVINLQLTYCDTAGIAIHW